MSFKFHIEMRNYHSEYSNNFHSKHHTYSSPCGRQFENWITYLIVILMAPSRILSSSYENEKTNPDDEQQHEKHVHIHIFWGEVIYV